eukprot:140449-Chlamydomonas_euryale.AAC.8
MEGTHELEQAYVERDMRCSMPCMANATIADICIHRQCAMPCCLGLEAVAVQRPPIREDEYLQADRAMAEQPTSDSPTGYAKKTCLAAAQVGILHVDRFRKPTIKTVTGSKQ